MAPYDHIANMFPSPFAFEPHGDERSAFEKMVKQFFAHEKKEQKFLDEYRETVAQHHNPLVKFLLQLIISDEEKHHNLVSSITSALQADLTGIHSGGVEVPTLGAISEEKREELLGLTAEFIAAEKETIVEYRALMKESQGCHMGLLVLLLKTIIHDSEKHLMILDFIDEKLRET